MTLQDYFEVERLYVNEPRMTPVGELNIIQTVHIMNGYGIVPTFGLMIQCIENGKKVYFTTDTQFNPDQIFAFYREADLIIQDCEIMPFESKVHAHYNKLKTLTADVKGKMWFNHCNDCDLLDVKADGFLGFLIKGQEIKIWEVV